MKYSCDTCHDTGEIDETLGGEPFSNPHTVCPDCDGKFVELETEDIADPFADYERAMSIL